MRKLQLVLGLSIVASLMFISTASAELPLGGVVGDDNITVVYDPASGNLSIDPAGEQISALELLSAAGNFTGTRPAQIDGLFDVYEPGKMFKLTPTGIPTDQLDFGPALAAGLDGAALAADLSADGAILPSGGLGAVDLAIVPEPSSIALLGIGLLGLIGVRRKRA